MEFLRLRRVPLQERPISDDAMDIVPQARKECFNFLSKKRQYLPFLKNITGLTHREIESSLYSSDDACSIALL